MRVPVAVALPLVAVLAAWLVPLPPAAAVARSPQEATRYAEDTLPALGVPWGKVRGWMRSGEGWEVVWQPSHGAWLVRVWIGDAPGPLVWRLDVAAWLSGVRLSRAAAAHLARAAPEAGVARERLGRRDWEFAGARVAGAVAAGSALPQQPGSPPSPFEAVLAGLILAGALARVLLPTMRGRGWMQWTTLGCVALALSSPLLTPLAARSFRAGVRPWVTQLAVVAAVTLVASSVALAASHFRASASRPPGSLLLLAGAAGLLAGRLEPLEWLVEAAAVPVRVLIWLGVVGVGGWLLAVAGDGARALLGRSRSSPWLLSATAVAAVPLAGPWLGPVLAAAAGATGQRGDGPWLAAAVLFGWTFGCTWAGCGWVEPLRDALLWLATGLAFATIVAEREHAVRARN